MTFLCLAFEAYSIILLARVLLSWLYQVWTPPSYLSPAIGVIYSVTEPVLRYIRGFIPPIAGLDLSPIIVFFILAAIQRAIGC